MEEAREKGEKTVEVSGYVRKEGASPEEEPNKSPIAGPVLLCQGLYFLAVCLTSATTGKWRGWRCLC